MAPAKVPIDEKTTYTDPAVQSSINAALLQAGSIPKIQRKMLYELQAAGWTKRVETMIVSLMRSGECTKMEDLMDRVMQEVNKGETVAGAGSGTGSGKDAKGAAKEVPNPFAIPQLAITESVKVIREELEKVSNVTDED